MCVVQFMKTENTSMPQTSRELHSLILEGDIWQIFWKLFCVIEKRLFFICVINFTKFQEAENYRSPNFQLYEYLENAFRLQISRLNFAF